MLQKTSFAYKSLAIIFLTFPFHLFSINYTITFTGSGASTTLDNVIVENLTKGTTTTVPAGNSLYLTDVSTSVETINSNTKGISVFPNPIIDNSTVSFQAKSTGNATIKVFSLEGKSLISAKNEFGVGTNSFQLSLPKGTYLIQIAANDYTYTAKAISKSNSKTSISFATNENTIKNKPQKVKSGLTSMLYSDGDQLLYRGMSGNYTAIVTDRPTTSKTTNFDFVECKDADGNYYATVKIGSQIWMAENLKTTKYRNVDAITNITDAYEWEMTNKSAWCVFGNSTSYKAKYGLLYNWYAVNDSRNITPLGWHIPSDVENRTLYNYVSTNFGNSLNAGKALAATTDWALTSSIGTIVAIGDNLSLNNSTGFSALPGGNRSQRGGFDNASYFGVWWSSTGFNATSSEYWSLFYASSAVGWWDIGGGHKNCGYTVRCVKD